MLCLAIFSFGNAQKIENNKIKLMDNESYNDYNNEFVFHATSDENNYYIDYFQQSFQMLSIGSLIKTENTFVIIDKSLKTMRKFVLNFQKGDTYRATLFTENFVGIICDNYDKKKKEMNIILKKYSKQTGEFIADITFAKVKTPSWNPWFYYSLSPDEKKFGFVFFVENQQEKFDEYHSFVLDLENNAEIIWKQTNNLKIANDNFNLSDIQINNEGTMYIVFNSKPNNKKTIDRNYYTDITILNENTNENTSVKSKYNEINNRSTKHTLLKNGNLFVSNLLVLNEKNKKGEEKYILNTIICDKDNADIVENNYFDLPALENKKMVKSSHSLVPKKTNINERIKDVIELENGDIATLIEQFYDLMMRDKYGVSYFHVRGNIITVLTNQKAVVESTNVYERFQESPLIKYLNLSYFSRNDDIFYLFNEDKDNYIGKKNIFDLKKYENAAFVCNKVSKEDSKLNFITQKNGSDLKSFQNIVYDDKKENKLLILTVNLKTIDIELLTIE